MVARVLHKILRCLNLALTNWSYGAASTVGVALKGCKMQLATTHLMSCKLFEKWWNGELAKHNKLTWISSPMAYATVGEFIAAAVALPSFQAVASSVTERTWCYTVACLLNLLSVQAWAIQLNCTCLTITSILALIKSDCLHLSMNEWWFLCSERMATSNGQASVLFSSDNLG